MGRTKSDISNSAIRIFLQDVGKFYPNKFTSTSDITHRPRHIRTSQISSSGDIISARKVLFFNQDLNIYKAHVTENMNYIDCDDNFYKNGNYDELIYVQEGEGVIHTQLGDLKYNNIIDYFDYFDYLDLVLVCA